MCHLQTVLRIEQRAWLEMLLVNYHYFLHEFRQGMFLT
jgi:hypothetical protein